MRERLAHLVPLVVGVLVGVVLFLVGVLAWLVVELKDTQGNLAANVHNQVVNRATNVEAWCGGINGSRDYNRRFVGRVTHGTVAYTLTDLPCEALVRKTLESPKHKGPVTAEDHPIVYRLLHTP